MINLVTKLAQEDSNWNILFTLLAIGMGVVAAVLVIVVDDISIIIAILIAPLFGLAILKRPDLGLYFLTFMVYTRLSYVLDKFHGAPPILLPFIFLLIGTVVFRWKFLDEPLQGWKAPLLLILSYGLMGLISLLHANDSKAVIKTLTDLSKDGLIAITIGLLLNTPERLRGAIWGLLFAGILLGTISTYQQLTGTFEENYWGFAKAEMRQIVGNQSDYRIAGPGLGPNDYGQILVFLIPLALDRVWSERSKKILFFAVWSLSACVLANFFTFSRSMFVAMMVGLIVMFVYRPPKPSAIVVTLIMGAF